MLQLVQVGDNKDCWIDARQVRAILPDDDDRATIYMDGDLQIFVQGSVQSVAEQLLDAMVVDAEIVEEP